MNHRLSPLHFLPPPVNTAWTGALLNPARGVLSRRHGEDIAMPLPLFWYDPPWYQITTDQADNLAVAVAEMDVLVAAMRSELAGPASESIFHSGRAIEADVAATPDITRRYPRILPYRSERYGLMSEDFDDCTILDLRLIMPRDLSGRFAYSPAQLQRWEATPATAPVAGGGWIHAATFPPDVVSMQHLASKIEQLRRLASSAAIFVSMGPYRMEEELPLLLAAKPDGLILRLDEILLDGLELAVLTRRAREMMDAHDAPSLPLWVVPGEITADDAVKLVALGASAVAIDAWCNALIEQTQVAQSESTTGYVSDSPHQYDPRWCEFARDQIGELTSRFLGLFESLQSVARDERLGSLSSSWVKNLGVRALR
ncbi:hypothetical protein [Novipirellula artificiosorum]|uniref:Uncharacterized protein n=1 Tax=Novipirellula artificiosorum TaxID=2528016 RepID=A0A5C6DK20_9BACT|nr:hypothetical protein [Novipirellula artificiosorum]TWU35941.1 hypothetical protein Poly41_36930 [Novipirellula artificiosorum]